MDREYNILVENDTYELVELPYGQKVVPGKWVYILKPDQVGTTRHRARWCAKGFHQEHDVNYEETFPQQEKCSQHVW